MTGTTTVHGLGCMGGRRIRDRMKVGCMCATMWWGNGSCNSAKLKPAKKAAAKLMRGHLVMSWGASTAQQLARGGPFWRGQGSLGNKLPSIFVGMGGMQAR